MRDGAFNRRPILLRKFDNQCLCDGVGEEEMSLPAPRAWLRPELGWLGQYLTTAGKIAFFLEWVRATE